MNIVVVIGRGSNERKFAPPDDVCQVSDESALSIYERGPKVGYWPFSQALECMLTTFPRSGWAQVLTLMRIRPFK